MGPTGKGTSIGIKSNITITSLPKQLAYYFLRIPPKIPTRISVNIFITSLSYPHPSVHHQSSVASFKILSRIFMSINITSITPVSKITYQEYPAKSSCKPAHYLTSFSYQQINYLFFSLWMVTARVAPAPKASVAAVATAAAAASIGNISFTSIIFNTLLNYLTSIISCFFSQ